MLEKLVALFRGQVEIRSAAMRDAVAKSDTAAARQAAHALKSSAGQVGAVGLRELCQRIEHAAMDGDASEVAVAVSELDAVVPAVDRWLTDRGFPRQS